MAEKLTTFDLADGLDTAEEIAIYLAGAFATRDPGLISHALGVVARSKGMTEIAKETGLSREQLYRSLSDEGNPTLKTMIALMGCLDVELTVKAHENDKNRARERTPA